MNEHDYALRDAAMAEFVDSYFKARPQLLRTRHEECLVEAGFKAAWKPDQTERAEKAEAELAKAREQKPAGYVFGDWRGATTISAVKSSHFNTPLYAAPVPAVAAPADLLNQLSIILSGEMVFDPPDHLVAAIPETWDDWDKSIYKKYLREAANSWGRRKMIMQARALLQSSGDPK